MKKPFWCRLGFHQWYSDGAMFVSALRCDRCNVWQNEVLGAQVEAERYRWIQDPDGMKRRYGLDE